MESLDVDLQRNRYNVLRYVVSSGFVFRSPTDEPYVERECSAQFGLQVRINSSHHVNVIVRRLRTLTDATESNLAGDSCVLQRCLPRHFRFVCGISSAHWRIGDVQRVLLVLDRRDPTLRRHRITSRPSPRRTSDPCRHGQRWSVCVRPIHVIISSSGPRDGPLVLRRLPVPCSGNRYSVSLGESIGSLSFQTSSA